MSIHERDNISSEKADTDDERLSEKGEPNKWQPTARSIPSSYDNPNYASLRNRTDSGPNRGDVVYTRSPTETERYLDNHGISLCKRPDVIRRTVMGRPVDYEQRVCLRYLQPPPLPPPGRLTIEEIRQPGVQAPPLIIREQPTIADDPPPLVLRERPPTPPIIPRAETKTVVIPSDSLQERSVIVERYPAYQEKPRDIIIERWLPYGPLPEREVVVKKIGGVAESKANCTIINYENPQPRVSRKFAVVDVFNADPDDYMARYNNSLLNSTELVEQVRRMGVTEDISSPFSVSFGVRVNRKRVDYRQSRSTICDCFSVDVTPSSFDLKYDDRSGQ